MSSHRSIAPNGLFPACTWISAAGYRFAFLEKGKGEPLLFLHGSLGTILDFMPAVRHFARSHRAMTYSRRFHPPNAHDHADPEYTVARHAEDAAALLGELHIESAHMVGSSWGAYVALYLAVQQPSFVRTLVLGEPPVLSLLQHSPVGRGLLEEFHGKTIQPSLAELRRGNAENGIRLFVDGVSGKTGNFDDLPARARQILLLSAEELRREFETPPAAYMPDLAAESLNGVKCPVLLLEGERSPKIFRLITDELELALPDTERVIITRAGHSMHTGNPGTYFSTVARFLRRHERENGPPIFR
jgi:pimeloyl-ACP methyl ester carboxylesterase